MIQVTNLTKRFDGAAALEAISCTIPEHCIYGLVGSNGAGKSTLLRTVCGIYRPDEGEVLVDGQTVYENPRAKERLMLVPDDLYFLHGATPARMEALYEAAFPRFDRLRFRQLIEMLNLPYKKPIQAFSKGMKRLTATALALAAKPQYLLFDETMDGLDPVMRHVVKSIIAEDVAERGTTAVVVSHSLRELEDLCDQLALVHAGGIVLQQDVSNLRTSLFKVQIAFHYPFDQTLFSELSIAHYSQHGSVANVIVCGSREQTEEILRAKAPLLMEVLPLTLEEVFTYEMQARGYDFNTILEGLSHEKNAV
ncbi:MAG: ABC transporter ATP-binding protein [Acutalibacteraceae bacterium]